MTQEDYIILTKKNCEHKVFNSDWEIYYSIDFAATLLPKIPLYRGNALWVFDGAELFAGSQKAKSRVLDIEGNGTLINLIAYTYPKDVKASTRKQFVQAAKSEVCLFAEVAQDDSIQLSFKLGKRFKDYLNSLRSEGVESPTLADVESQTYLTTIADFKAFFDNQLVHEDLMRFVLDTIGVSIDFESDTQSKLVMFFRSEMQAKGFPKEDKFQKVRINGNEVQKKLSDMEYDMAFGFDIFNPRLYGYNTAVYEVEKNSTGDERMINSRKTLENYFEKDEFLKTELENSKRRTFYIDDNFEITNNRVNDTTYYIPNILVKPSKEVKVFLKYFNSENNKGIKANLSLSAKKGIEDFTRTLSFRNASGRNILPITVKTNANEYIEEKIALTVAYDENGETKVIGKLNILPNTEIKPKFVFANVFFTKGEASNLSAANENSSYKNLVDELNAKAFNQSCINIDYCNTKRFEVGYSNTVVNSFGDKDNSKILRNLINPNDFATDLGGILYTLKYHFYKQLAQHIFNEIEQGLQEVIFTLGGEEVPLIPSEMTLEELMNYDIGSKYDTCMNYLTSYLSRDMNLNVFVAFMCQGLKTDGKPTASGVVGGSGLIVLEFLEQNGKRTSNLNSTMIIAHEIGHNFGLRHTFDNQEGEGDLKLKQGQTLENIMDYLPDAEDTYKSLITYQWEKMRAYLHANKNTVEELSIKISEEKLGNGFLYLEDFSNSIVSNFRSNLSAFSNDSLRGIVNGCIKYYREELGDSIFSEITNKLDSSNFQENVLNIFIKCISKQINQLCS